MKSWNIEQYLKESGFQKTGFRELSKNNQGESLVPSETERAYCFDDVVKKVFPKGTPTSADAILFDRNNWITLIEFKGGFEDVSENTKRKREELTRELLLKGVESRWVLEYHIAASCNESDERQYSVRYIAVINKAKGFGVDARESFLSELAETPTPDRNAIQTIRNSLSRLANQSKEGRPAYYQEVRVMDNDEFSGSRYDKQE